MRAGREPRRHLGRGTGRDDARGGDDGVDARDAAADVGDDFDSGHHR
jgi:hypothetical protein